jgi:transcriptional regulator of arginine metabolism
VPIRRRTDAGEGDRAAVKQARQERVAEILDRNEVHSQPQLAALLEVEGFVVAQATLSRDLRELGAIRTAGGYRLAEPLRKTRRRAERTARAARPGRGLLGSGVRSVARTGSTIVLRTEPEAASRVARRIDAAQWHGVLGTIAGQDTVFVALVSASVARSLETRLLADR